jgi:signal recognition particle subunit SRP72
MAAAIPDLAALLKQTHLASHDDILKSANAALKKNKADKSAQHTRVVALLKLDRFDDALRALDEGGDKLKDAARLEYAYALYKTGELEKSEHVSSSGGGQPSRGLQHISAQAVRLCMLSIQRKRN